MEDVIFSISNSIALVSWIVLILFPFKDWTAKYVLGIIISALAILYASLIFTAMEGDGGFSSLEEVMLLFENKRAVLAGWIHYLAFDLMVGLFIIKSAIKHQINRYIIIPALILTFMLGPVGLVIYLLIRSIKTKSYFYNYL